MSQDASMTLSKRNLSKVSGFPSIRASAFPSKLAIPSEPEMELGWKRKWWFSNGMLPTRPHDETVAVEYGGGKCLLYRAGAIYPTVQVALTRSI